jgi:phospholipid-binding lipoprotein MlaA
MTENRFKRRLTALILVLFSSIGCAHHTPAIPFAGSVKSLPHQNTETRDLENGESLTEEEDDDEFFDEEFDLIEGEPMRVADPLKPWNVAMFHVNDKLILWVIVPVAKGYRAVTPVVVRIGIKNFFKNLYTPVRMVNCLLQGKGVAAEKEFARLLVNSTIGFLGFGDPAGKHPQLTRPGAEDLGQTLGVYGVGDGFYIVWPLLGPSTLRNSIGTIGDGFLNPLAHMFSSDSSHGVELHILGKINGASFYIGEYKAFKEATINPYVSQRDIYLQLREKKIKE